MLRLLTVIIIILFAAQGINAETRVGFYEIFLGDTRASVKQRSFHLCDRNNEENWQVSASHEPVIIYGPCAENPRGLLDGIMITLRFSKKDRLKDMQIRTRADPKKWAQALEKQYGTPKGDPANTFLYWYFENRKLRMTLSWVVREEGLTSVEAAFMDMYP